MGVSLARFDTKTKANAGIEIELLDARTGVGSGAFITVRGTDSDEFRAFNADRARIHLERIREHGAKTKQQSAAEADEDGAELLAACTVGWRDLDNEDGTPLAFSPAAAKALYLKYPLIREQIDRAIADRSAFLKA